MPLTCSSGDDGEQSALADVPHNHPHRLAYTLILLVTLPDGVGEQEEQGGLVEDQQRDRWGWGNIIMQKKAGFLIVEKGWIFELSYDTYPYKWLNVH